MSKEPSDRGAEGASALSAAAAHRLFDQFLDDFPQGALIFEGETVLAANEAYAEIVDYSVEELAGMPLQRLAALPWEAVDDKLRELRAQGRQSSRIPVRTRTGSVKTLEYVARAEVSPGRSIVFVRDVTEEEARERELGIKAEVLDSLADGVYVVGMDGRIALWNRSAEEITGYSAEEVIGSRLETLRLAPQAELDAIRQWVLAEMQRPPQGDARRPTSVVVTGLRRRADGSIYPSWAEVSVLRDEQDRPAAVLVMLHDLARERARAAGVGTAVPPGGINSLLVSVGRDAIAGAAPSELLATAVDRLAIDLDAPLVASWRMDARVGRVELEAGHGWPDAAVVSVGIESADVSRMLSEAPFAFTGAAWEPGSPLDRAEVRSGILAPIKGHGRSEAALAIYSRDERRFATEDVEAVAAVAELIAAARARVRISRLEGALDVARRQASVGALISGVAHDFNNMLSVMLGYARLMEEESEGSELLTEGVTEIQSAARRAMRLSRSLVDLGLEPSSEPELLEVGAIVDEVTELLHRTLGDRITLRTQIAEPALHVLMPPGELDRAIVNLVANARDALPGGGIVLIRVEQVPVPDSDGLVADDVMVEVSDNGVGMPSEVLERALEPSFTTKPRGEGSGVGLAAVQSIVGSAGGRLELASVEGEGTTVRMLIPSVLPPPD